MKNHVTASQQDIVAQILPKLDQVITSTADLANIFNVSQRSQTTEFTRLLQSLLADQTTAIKSSQRVSDARRVSSVAHSVNRTTASQDKLTKTTGRTAQKRSQCTLSTELIAHVLKKLARIRTARTLSPLGACLDPSKYSLLPC
jgi:hypothetical protein